MATPSVSHRRGHPHPHPHLSSSSPRPPLGVSMPYGSSTDPRTTTNSGGGANGVRHARSSSGSSATHHDTHGRASSSALDRDGDEEWKMALKETIIQNLQPILLDTRRAYDQALQQLSSSSSAGGSISASSPSSPAPIQSPTYPSHPSFTIPIATPQFTPSSTSLSIPQQKQKLKERYDEAVRGLKRLADEQFEDEVRRIMEDRERAIQRTKAKAKSRDDTPIIEEDEHAEIGEMDPENEDDDDEQIIARGLGLAGPPINEDDPSSMSGRRRRTTSAGPRAKPDWEAVFQEQQVILDEIRRRRLKQREEEDGIRNMEYKFSNSSLREKDGWLDSPGAGPSGSPSQSNFYPPPAASGSRSMAIPMNGSAGSSSSTSSSADVGSLGHTGATSSSFSSSYSSSLPKSYQRAYLQHALGLGSPSTSPQKERFQPTSPLTSNPIIPNVGGGSTSHTPQPQPSSRSQTPAQRQVFEQQQLEFRLREQEIRKRVAERKKQDQLNWQESVTLAPTDEEIARSRAKRYGTPATNGTSGGSRPVDVSRPRSATTGGYVVGPNYGSPTGSTQGSAAFNPGSSPLKYTTYGGGHRRSTSTSSTNSTSTSTTPQPPQGYQPTYTPTSGHTHARRATTPSMTASPWVSQSRATAYAHGQAPIQAPQPKYKSSLFTSMSSASSSASGSRPNSAKPGTPATPTATATSAWAKITQPGSRTQTPQTAPASTTTYSQSRTHTPSYSSHQKHQTSQPHPPYMQPSSSTPYWQSTTAPYHHSSAAIPMSHQRSAQPITLTPSQVHHIRSTHAYQWSKIPSYVTLKWEDFPWPVVLPPQAAPPPASRSRSTSSSYSYSSNSSGSSSYSYSHARTRTLSNATSSSSIVKARSPADIDYEGVKAYIELVVFGDDDDEESERGALNGDDDGPLNEDEDDDEEAGGDEDGDEEEGEEDKILYGRSSAGTTRTPAGTRRNITRLAHAKILEQVRQWHPDRFEVKYLRRVEDEREREMVKEGAGKVVRSLNEMLERM